MKVKTNNVPRPWLTYSDMDLLQQKQAEEEMAADEMYDFIGFHYKGHFYHFKEFLRQTDENGWHPSMETPRICIKLNEREETVIVGNTIRE